MLGYTETLVGSNYVDNLYLVTNGVSQFIVNTNGSYSILNSKGQVIGLDNSGNLYLYFNGITQTLAVKKYSLYPVGLNNNGEAVWNAQDTATAPNQVYTYQNGITKNLGAHTARGVNNLGQITGNKEIYTNGAWQAVPNLPDSGSLNDKGQVFFGTEVNGTENGFPQEYVTYGVYTLATNSTFILLSGSGNQYVPPPGISGYNLEGDYIGGKAAGTGTSTIQYIGFGRSRGQNISFGYFVNYPTQQLAEGGVTALNNNGDILGYNGNNIYDSAAGIFYNADTGVYNSLSNFITGSNGGASYNGLLLNDRRYFVLQTGYPAVYYLAAPNGSVGGVAALEGISANAPAQILTFEFRNALDTPLFTVTASVGPDGTYTLPNIAAGIYHVRVKGSKYLAQVMTVNSSGGAVTSANITLPVGDANNDNTVDTSDFNILAGAFGSSLSVAGSGYDIRADFNGDGVVDTSDFNLLVGGFGNTGDL